MKKESVLVVDDEGQMRKLIKIYLSKEYHVVEASNGIEALKLFENNKFHVVLLDIMMPDINGWEVCKKIRNIDKKIPILMLTARRDIEDKVFGLSIGADDYLVKPFNPSELAARVKALLRRANIDSDSGVNDEIKFGKIVINVPSRQVMVSKNEVILTPKEFDLLLELSLHPKQVFTREVLLDKIWSKTDVLDNRTVDTHIKNIREKLKKAGIAYNPIKTVWGVGYKMEIEEEIM